MKQHKWIMALAAVGLLALALPAHGQVGADGVKAQTLTGQRLVGVKSDSTQKVIGADGSGSGLNISDTSRDRNLDFGVTNLLTSTAIDTGLGGSNYRYSVPVDVRQYSTGRIIVHITTVAADTIGHYVYGVTLYPLTSATADWAVVGVPIVAGINPSAIDTLGFKGGLSGIAATATQTYPGERAVVLTSDRVNNYANIEAGKTVSYSWDVWLGPNARPRYLLVQVRLMSRDVATIGPPSVRVDLEGLR